MSSKSVELADAIVSKLNDGSTDFEFAFEAVRLAAPMTLKELEDLSELKVAVFTGNVKAERRVQRGTNAFRRSYKPVIALYRRLDGLTEEANLEVTDGLTLLAQQIDASLENVELADLSFLAFDEEQDRELYNPEIMRDLGVFVLVITLEYSD